MKIDYKKIINIKTKKELLKYSLDKPIFYTNYLFHYLIQFGNIHALKFYKFPIYKENEDGLNGFDLAAKGLNLDILYYLIENYSDYIYNRNKFGNMFSSYLPIDSFSNLIQTYPKLDWAYLILDGHKESNFILFNIIYNLNYIQLQKFNKLFHIKVSNKNTILISIIYNSYLTSNEKIKILDEYTDEEINIKDNSGEGLIYGSFNDVIIFDYLMNRNIDIDYSGHVWDSIPLFRAYIVDCINNKIQFTNKILEKLNVINPYFYKLLNINLENIAHIICLVRMDQSTKINIVSNVIKMDYSLDLLILNKCDSECFNMIDIFKQTPLELLVHLDYNIYSKILIENNISVSSDVINKLENEILTNTDLVNKLENNTKWITLYKKLPIYNKNQNVDIKYELYEYVHTTSFRAYTIDIIFYVLYLEKTYNELLIPNLILYTLPINNIIPLKNINIAYFHEFPWIISYLSPDEYYIHPYLNNIINAERREGNKLYACIMVSIIGDAYNHANILFYDFKKLTIERFEPYGNNKYNNSYSRMDDIFEEELTWNTGLTYLRPGDYLPDIGFQSISNENININNKPGDFGGFCLAWCLWYVETKLKNSDINSKILVQKLLTKLSNLNIKFSEYIRNYSNFINDKRIIYLKLLGIDPKIISNKEMDNKSENIIYNYIKNINSQNNLKL
jgi:hypothetical protein